MKPIGGGLFGILGGGWFGFSKIRTVDVIFGVDVVMVACVDISLAPLIVFETEVDIELKSSIFF